MTEATPLASEQITQEADELEALIGKATDCDLADEGRYFSETCNDLTSCRHGETGEYNDQHDGPLVEFLWNHRHHYLSLLRSAALSASPAPSGQGVSVPKGMKPWHGRGSAPDDWDRGPVLHRRHGIVDFPTDTEWRLGRIIAYTPKPAPAPSCVPGEVERSTVAFVQDWLMSSDHEPTQWDREFAAAIEARAAGITDALVAQMVSRFLAWKLPADFAPDAGISYCPPAFLGGEARPTGTNLFTAAQADGMVRNMLAAALSPQGLDAKEGGE